VHFEPSHYDEAYKVPFMLLHPHSNFKVAWSCLIYLIVMETAIITPVRVAFFDETDSVDNTIW
jgi:hypothetical protein